jgi:hypothetical protein
MSRAAKAAALAALLGACRTAAEPVRPQVVLVKWLDAGELSTPERVVGIDELPLLWTRTAHANDQAIGDGGLPSRYGCMIANVGDIEGGGADGLLVGARSDSFMEAVDLIAGEAQVRSRRVLGTFLSEGCSGVVALGDLDRDGRRDFAEIEHDDSWFDERVRVHVSGKDAVVVIHSLEKGAFGDVGTSVQALMGERADLDGDGWGDVLVTARTVDEEPPSRAAAYFHSSRTGARLGVLEREVGANDGHGIAATNSSWIAVSSPLEDDGAGRVRIWSADDREPHIQFRGGERVRLLGARLAWVGEHELAMSSPWTSEARGLVLVYDVRSRRLIRSWSGDVPHACFGLALDGSRDLDGDGARDLVVGAPGNVLDPAAPGTVEVLSVSSGRRLLRILGPPTERSLWHDLPWNEDYVVSNPTLLLDAPTSDSFGYAVAAANLDRDERADLVIGHPCRGPEHLVGKVHAVSGVELRKRIAGAR